MGGFDFPNRAMTLLSSYPARVLALVIPRVDVLATADSVADKVRVTIVADFFVADYPTGAGVHIRL